MSSDVARGHTGSSLQRGLFGQTCPGDKMLRVQVTHSTVGSGSQGLRSGLGAGEAATSL